jgi:hypothetical protein
VLHKHNARRTHKYDLYRNPTLLLTNQITICSSTNCISIHASSRQPTFPAAHAKARFPAAFATAEAIGDLAHAAATEPRKPRPNRAPRDASGYVAQASVNHVAPPKPPHHGADFWRVRIIRTISFVATITTHTRSDYRAEIRRAERSRSVILKTSRQGYQHHHDCPITRSPSVAGGR